MQQLDSASDESIAALALALQNLCLDKGLWVATAESCTGGGVAEAITAIAGSSGYFETGYVTYSNRAKTRLLGVKSATLDVHGAVSKEVVREMVSGACRDSQADIAVAISGVAGPGGGTESKPVGTVWLAWGGFSAQEVHCAHFEGDRASVRQQAVKLALVGLIQQAQNFSK